MLLGEARSMCEQIAGAPLRPEDAQGLYEVYLTKGVHATTSIEGNTLSEDEVRQRIEGKLTLPKSREYLGHEVDNIVAACNQIVSAIREVPDRPPTPDEIRRFNWLAIGGLEVDEDTTPGEFRRHSVGVAGYRGAPAEDCPYLMARLCDWLNGPDFRPSDRELAFAFAVLKAVMAHLYIAWIHPFGDGNGRTARLAEFQWLVQSGMVPLPAGHLFSNHYNKTRSRYYRELDRASRSGGEVVPFLHYALEGFVDGLREQLEYIRQHQYHDMWINYVHDRFRDQDTPASRRRKHLILDMPATGARVAEIAGLSPRLAAAYATKGEKTLTRDSNALIEMGLLRRAGRTLVPNRDLILAFLPPKVRAEA
jgi:cell filamentation protein, protein adenylyltransferase